MLLDDGPAPDPAEVARERRTRLAAFAGSVLVTAVLVAAVLGLGNWAYRYRQLTLHHGRLQRLVQAEPRVDQVAEALAGEGATPVALSDAADLGAFTTRLSRTDAEQVIARGRRYPGVRVFAVAGHFYVLFFDEKGVLRDFVLAR